MSSSTPSTDPPEAFVVYTDMVADLFHAGHVAFLRSARAVAKTRSSGRPVRLVVGVVSDDDASAYKRLPVMSSAERAIVLGECRLVDAVVEAPPVPVTSEFLRDLAADLVLHGDDMDEPELHHWYAEAIALGIFETVPYTHDIGGIAISTTEVIRRARQ